MEEGPIKNGRGTNTSRYQENEGRENQSAQYKSLTRCRGAIGFHEHHCFDSLAVHSVAMSLETQAGQKGRLRFQRIRCRLFAESIINLKS